MNSHLSHKFSQIQTRKSSALACTWQVLTSFMETILSCLPASSDACRDKATYIAAKVGPTMGGGIVLYSHIIKWYQTSPVNPANSKLNTQLIIQDEPPKGTKIEAKTSPHFNMTQKLTATNNMTTNLNAAFLLVKKLKFNTKAPWSRIRGYQQTLISGPQNVSDHRKVWRRCIFPFKT